VNETDKSKQDEQERAHQVRKDERAKMFDKAGVGTTTRQ